MCVSAIGLKDKMDYLQELEAGMDHKGQSLGKLGIATLRDLISYFPRAYDDRTQLRRIADLVPGETAGVAAMVASPPTISHIRKGLDLVKLRAVDDTGTWM